NLDGKVALVTGAARGLGQSMAIGLAEAGADIAMLDVNSLAETQQRFSPLGRKSTIVREDLRELSAMRAAELIDQCVRSLGRLDILVNAAGIIRRASAIEVTEQDWDSVLSINLRSAFLLSQATGRHFIKHHQPGKIINVASMLSFQGGMLASS